MEIPMEQRLNLVIECDDDLYVGVLEVKKKIIL